MKSADIVVQRDGPTFQIQNLLPIEQRSLDLSQQVISGAGFCQRHARRQPELNRFHAWAVAASQRRRRPGTVEFGQAEPLLVRIAHRVFRLKFGTQAQVKLLHSQTAGVVLPGVSAVI